MRERGDINVGIVTIKRKKNNYLNDCLESLRQAYDGPVKFYCGNRDSSFVLTLMRAADSLHQLPDQVLPGHGTHVNSVVNHALAYLLSNTVLEDDVICSSKFEPMLLEAIDECYYVRPSGHFLLSLWSPRIWPRGAVIAPYPINIYYGSQGIYVPPELQFDIFRFMVANLDNGRQGADIVLAEYCTARGIPLYCCTQSIVRHIGVESAMQDDETHVETPSYVA